MEMLPQQRQSGVLLLARRLRLILWDRDIEYSELSSGFFGVLGGIVIALPYWDVFAFTPSFMVLPVPEWLVGLLIALMSALQFIAVLLDGRLGRKAFAVLNFLMWTWLFYMQVLSNWHLLIWVLFLSFAATNFHAFLRLIFTPIRE